MEEKEWELVIYETDHLNSDDEYWCIDYGFTVSRNKEGKLKVDAYLYDKCTKGDVDYIEFLLEDYIDGEEEDSKDAKEILDSIKMNEYIFNSPEELYEAIDKNKLYIKRGLDITGLVKYNTLNNLCKKLDYKHLMG